ncbi:MAG TPA: hypothetical protein VNB50_07845 [Gaiellaceae bacterium]|nr:hypothetical protein [Gaiellaceae bacterium]
MAKVLGDMRITPQAVNALRTCAICERTLLVGERSVRFSHDGEHFVDVCPLCLETAADHGWIKEGSPTTPVVNDRRRRRRGLSALFDSKRPAVEPVVDEPILRRLSEPELAMVEAADLFNESAFRRTIAGIAKSLGDPKASIVPLSGTNAEVVLTVAWDISWYQYRITPESGQPVRLAERGHDPRELETMFTGWNAKLTQDGRIVPEISPV